MWNKMWYQYDIKEETIYLPSVWSVKLLTMVHIWIYINCVCIVYVYSVIYLDLEITRIQEQGIYNTYWGGGGN